MSCHVSDVPLPLLRILPHCDAGEDPPAGAGPAPDELTGEAGLAGPPSGWVVTGVALQRAGWWQGSEGSQGWRVARLFPGHHLAMSKLHRAVNSQMTT